MSRNTDALPGAAPAVTHNDGCMMRREVTDVISHGLMQPLQTAPDWEVSVL